ncbi:MAG TPA: heme-binding protein [Bryobacteraceae bacterium]|nr:heme-binding protein [Bryobacteraceae bacterium]
MKKTAKIAIVLVSAFAGMTNAWADCASLPNQAALKAALVAAVTTESSGLDLNMWATIVDRDGIVCAVAFLGTDRGAQWPGSRVISAQKANTANSFSLDSSAASGAAKTGLALSTANLYSAVQPGGSLFGLQESNPVNTDVAYGGNAINFGSSIDPMVGGRIGGVNVFGGGFALYAAGRTIVGAVGVSGDTSCADHRIGWLVRHNLALDHLKGVGGVSGDADRPDNIVFDLNPGTGKSSGGFGHPSCTAADGDPKTLPGVAP